MCLYLSYQIGVDKWSKPSIHLDIPTKREKKRRPLIWRTGIKTTKPSKHHPRQAPCRVCLNSHPSLSAV
ncbi:hypothetical protein EYC84_004135 [Monilinia fructicola]|uniref:Uncharacterized protein n=1 Tax=Monilinia fructicola TaxID=38448 RepID=A0A5M9K403_MONFR|nr:hypothetical protein EYC84_004135 [Monilinia fructicola]